MLKAREIRYCRYWVVNRIAEIAMVLLSNVVGTELLAQKTDHGPPPGTLIDIGGRKLHILCYSLDDMLGNGMPATTTDFDLLCASSF